MLLVMRSHYSDVERTEKLVREGFGVKKVISTCQDCYRDLQAYDRFIS